MNVLTRGVRNTLRSPLRSGAIAAMLAISIALILAMLVAKASVEAKIEEVKASTATQITVNPAGMQGGMGAGEPLSSEQVETIKNTDHIDSIVATLTDQVSADNTDLEPAMDLGQQSGGGQIRMMGPGGQQMTSMPIFVTGTNDPEARIAADTLTSGEMIDGDSTELAALVGQDLAEKNSLTVGDTFTMHDQEIAVAGIYSTDNRFNDMGIVMSLAAVQKITDQEGEVANVTATADSSDNVAGVISSLEEDLGDEIDITSQEEQAASLVAPLESITSLALTGVIGAAIATGVIILLSMIMIVRERRREIGVIKAIGGTNIKVIAQFVTEAMTLTVVGAIVGLGLGVLASGPITQSLVSNSDDSGSQSPNQSRMAGGSAQAGPGRVAFGGPGGLAGLQTNLSNVTGTLTPEIFFGSIGIILLIAGIGSAIPAYAIARVRPAEVLRTE